MSAQIDSSQLSGCQRLSTLRAITVSSVIRADMIIFLQISPGFAIDLDFAKLFKRTETTTLRIELTWETRDQILVGSGGRCRIWRVERRN